MDDEMREWLAEGIARAKAGQREQAREMLLRVVERDERNVQAWLWLSGLVDDLQDRRVALENVLAIEPENAFARAGLNWLDQQSLSQPPPIAQSPLEQEPLDAVPQDQAPAPAESEATLEEERCPSCGQSVIANDSRCPHCAQLLAVHEPRVREFPAPVGWLSAAYVIQAVATLLDILLMYLSLQAMAVTEKTLGTAYLYTYLAGTAFKSSPPTTALLQGLRFLFVVNVIVLAWSLTVAAILPARRQAAPLAALFVTALHFVLAVATWVVGTSALLIAVPRAALALFLGLWLLESHGDFEWVATRHRLELDSSARSSMDYYTQGRYYRRQGQTAKAILHLERAVELNAERFDYRVALGNAYYAMGQYDHAAEQLSAALQLNPNAPDVRELLAIVTQRRSSGEPRMA